jgi:hypothetical protein
MRGRHFQHILKGKKMSTQKKIALGILLLMAIPITYRAIASLGIAIEDLFLLWRFLAPAGRSREVLYDVNLLIPGAYWSVIGVLIWIVFFAVRRRTGVNRQ